MSAQRQAALFAIVCVILLALGLWRNAWWTLLGAVGAAATSAWLITEDP